MRGALLALLALLALTAPVPVAAAAPVPPVRGIGISNVGADTPLARIDRELADARALGATTVRFEVSWAALAPRGPEDRQPDYLARLDRVVAGARARGLKPLMLLARSPCWASSAPAAPGSCSATQDYPPRRAGDYADIAAWLVRRYRGRLAAVEVWNEPDHRSEAYFKGPDKPRRYAALLKAAYAAIKRVQPRLPVLGGSLVGADGAFLRALYDEGIQGSYDGLAVHYYDLSLASLRAIREVQRKAGDRKPLWLTEFGWTSCFPSARTQGEHKCVTRAQQARNLGDIFRALRGKAYVRGAVVYKLRDRPGEDFGMTTAGGARKPAFGVLRRAFRVGLGRPRRPTARVRGGVLTGTAPAGDIVTIQGFRPDGSFFYQAIVAPDRFGRFSVRLPAAVRGNRLVVEQPWTGRSVTLRG